MGVGCLRKYTFLSVEQSELDRSLAPSQMRFAAQHVMRPRAGWGLNGDACSRIVILSVVHTCCKLFSLDALRWVCIGQGNVVFLDSTDRPAR